VNHRFECIDVFNVAIPAWDLNFQQRGGGKLHSPVNYMLSDGLLFNRISLNQPVVQEGAAPSLHLNGQKVSARNLEQFATGSQMGCGRNF
jgi:hypothetical protein